jgi:hypothetical protein
LILRETVCDAHVQVARRRGYLVRATIDRRLVADQRPPAASA